MKRRPLYSRSGQPRGSTVGGAGPRRASEHPAYLDPAVEDSGPTLRQRFRSARERLYAAHPRKALIASSVLLTLLVMGAYEVLRPPGQHLSQRDLTAAVNYALDERPRDPALGAVAYAKVIQSVVRVSGVTIGGQSELDDPDEAQADAEFQEDFHERFTAIGTGVVIDESGTILTNLHVAGATPRLRVQFWDGSESDARIVGAQPESDLAVIRAFTTPDDLPPATLAASTDLLPGDDVVAVGFPFGIGPSASSGVISGLGRTLRQEGERGLSNLIQFDAAANPGNSGGPLVNVDGEVVGIVTAILNPSGVRTFAGIGFAVPIETAAGAAGESPL